jgi:hypothetical protein
VQAGVALDIFYRVLRDAGRGHNDPASPNFGSYAAGFDAIDVLFPKTIRTGDISLSSRSVKTSNGGDINIIAPGSGLSLGFDIPQNGEAPPGIVTEDGGTIAIFTKGSVEVGALRIFTLRGGDEIIWSSKGDIAAGNASKTVKTAPPTRVVIDAQSADVQTDLAGLATGGGIGVLASVAGVKPGNVDLIAPNGTVDAGDAGIRATGNLTIAAVQVLNADNVQAGGSSSGVPTAAPALSISLGSISAPNSTAASASSAAEQERKPQEQAPPTVDEAPSLFTVQVIGYGGGDSTPDEDEELKRKRSAPR